MIQLAIPVLVPGRGAGSCGRRRLGLRRPALIPRRNAYSGPAAGYCARTRRWPCISLSRLLLFDALLLSTLPVFPASSIPTFYPCSSSPGKTVHGNETKPIEEFGVYEVGGAEMSGRDAAYLMFKTLGYGNIHGDVCEVTHWNQGLNMLFLTVRPVNETTTTPISYRTTWLRQPEALKPASRHSDIGRRARTS